MTQPYEVLAAEYLRLLGVMTVTRADEVDATAKRCLSRKARYSEVSARTGVPIAWLLAIDEREGGGDPLSYFGNGEHVIGNGKRTEKMPKGRGPFATWQDGAIDAIQYDRVDEVLNWNVPRACYEAEVWNGFGPRNHGRHSGYLWSGTSVYDGGKYLSDHQWDPNAQDQQVGVVPVILRLAELDSTLTLPVSPVPIPNPPPQGYNDAIWVQRALNSLGQSPPLVEDGSYGRKTRAAVRSFQAAHGLTQDGIAGPETRAVIQVALELAA